MHGLRSGFDSSSITPTGSGNGWWPVRSRSSESCWMRGSWLTAGYGYGVERHGSVGSAPRVPCTWYSRSASV